MFIKFHHHHFSFRKFLCISLLLGFLTTTAIHLSKAEINKESPNPLASLTASSPASATTNTNDTWKISYFHHDHLGNITAVTDEHGNLLEVKDYLPFGGTNVHETYGDYQSDYSYNDKEKDDESNLYYYGARYYNAATGKFTSIDPAVLAIGTKQLKKITGESLQEFLANPQNLNSYSYARNNPIANTDENGEYTNSEIILAITHPIMTSKVNKLATLSFSTTQKLFREKYNHFHNNPPDAFRHALWSALLTKNIGEYWAKIYTDAHENYPENPDGEKDMDQFNNSIGREIGKKFINNPDATDEDIIQAVLDALENGQLQTEVESKEEEEDSVNESYPENGDTNENTAEYDPDDTMYDNGTEYEKEPEAIN